MWTRKEIKRTGKARFLKNYWKGVLVALILSIVLGAYSGISSKNDIKITSNTVTPVTVGTAKDMFEEIDEKGFNEVIAELGDISEEDQKEIQNAEQVFNDNVDIILPAVFGTVFVVLSIIFAFALGLNIFLFNPVEVGTRKYFVKNETEDASLKEMGVSFSNDYLNIVKVMFLRDLFTVLWSLLFIIPGIIKMYEYRQIPYLLAENPDMSTDEAFELSKKMMKGNKWKTFVLDLSFIGWQILSGLTAGLLGIFFVNPYVFQTNAALYNTLKGQNSIEETPENYESYIEVE